MIAKRITYIVLLFAFSLVLRAQNPIVKNMGVNDPHIHIFNDTAYLYASHDKSMDSKGFVMEDWWVWSSPDLVNWTHRSTLKPEDTYIGRPFNKCWATDAAYKNGKYYFYFSEANQQTGVVMANTPAGPWISPLGGPLLDSTLTPTHEYDACVFEDDGKYYIIFGVWEYYIARLADDMISLAEVPRKIIINNAHGPYNQDGKNEKMPTDDKPFVHKYNNKFYLSWGAFYAMSESVYGPYDYKAAVINQHSFAEGYDKPTWPNGFLQGRHGSFFQWKGQWYFAYCDISQTGNRYFRDTFISYVHYKNNGEIAPIRVDGTGVANYDAKAGMQAEDFFTISGGTVVEGNNGFVAKILDTDAVLHYPKCKGLAVMSQVKIVASIPAQTSGVVEFRSMGLNGKLLASINVSGSSATSFSTYSASFSSPLDATDIYVVIKGGQHFLLDSISFN